MTRQLLCCSAIVEAPDGARHSVARMKFTAPPLVLPLREASGAGIEKPRGRRHFLA